MLDENRLKQSLVAAFNEQSEETDAEAAIDRIMGKVARAIVLEVKQLQVVYSAGLTAGPNPVVGQFNHTVQ